jgi:hypothetical protein
LKEHFDKQVAEIKEKLPRDRQGIVEPNALQETRGLSLEKISLGQVAETLRGRRS